MDVNNFCICGMIGYIFLVTFDGGLTFTQICWVYFQEEISWSFGLCWDMDGVWKGMKMRKGVREVICGEQLKRGCYCICFNIKCNMFYFIINIVIIE